MLTFIWRYVFHCKVTTFLKDTCVARGDVVIKALRREPAGRGFDSLMVSLEFFSDRSHYDPGVDSASNRNKYLAYFLRKN